MCRQKTNWNYDSVSAFYQELANVYSFGMIKRSKIMQLSKMKAKKKVLYVGVGSGEDAVLAAQKGLDVTCIDVSVKMLRRTKRKFNELNLSGRFILKSILDYREYEKYDYVAVNYFLNNFSEPVVEQLLCHITKLLKKNGKFMIADFMTYSSNRFVRGIQNVNFMIAVTFFSMLGVTLYHKQSDYRKYFKKAGLAFESMRYCEAMGHKIPLYGVIIAVRL